MINKLLASIYRLILSSVCVVLYFPICIYIIFGWGIMGLINSETNLKEVLKNIWED